MNKLKNFFINLTRRAFNAEEASTFRTNLNYEKAKTVGVLFTSTNLESIEALADFIKTLQKDGKQVQSLTYYNTKEKDSLRVYNFNHHVITEKDVTASGAIKSFLADDFVNTEFDYLFCVETVHNPIFDTILGRSKAKCRIGRFSEGQLCFELMIKMEENEGTNALMKQMYHYVKTIRNDEK